MISIGCTQCFEIKVTRPLVDMLLKLSSTHYDGVCKDASKQGGFIYGWNNRVTWAEEEKRTEEVISSLTNRDLQTCLKICENSLPLPPELATLRFTFTRYAVKALRQANDDERFKTTVEVTL